MRATHEATRQARSRKEVVFTLFAFSPRLQVRGYCLRLRG